MAGEKQRELGRQEDRQLPPPVGRAYSGIVAARHDGEGLMQRLRCGQDGGVADGGAEVRMMAPGAAVAAGDGMAVGLGRDVCSSNDL